MTQPGLNSDSPDPKAHALGYATVLSACSLPWYLKWPWEVKTRNGSSLCAQWLCYPNIHVVIAGHGQGVQEVVTGSGQRTLLACSAVADSAGSVPDKGTGLTSVTLDAHSRSQRHALGLWAVTAMTIWTLWVPSFCKARRANCIFKVGCLWKWWEGGPGFLGGMMWRENKGDERQRHQRELQVGKWRQLWCDCFLKILTHTGH